MSPGFRTVASPRRTVQVSPGDPIPADQSVTFELTTPTGRWVDETRNSAPAESVVVALDVCAFDPTVVAVDFGVGVCNREPRVGHRIRRRRGANDEQRARPSR